MREPLLMCCARRLHLWLAFVVSLQALVSASRADESNIVVRCTDEPLDAALVSISIEESGVKAPRPGTRTMLRPTDGGSPVPAQVHDGRLWWVVNQLERGATRVYEITTKAPPPSTLRVEMSERCLDITRHGRLALRYHHQPVPSPEGVNALYTRSGFIHPLCSPSGATLTRMHPPDHYHHMGLWAPWTHARFEGRSIDFWNLGKGQGTVRCANIKITADGPVFCEFEAVQEHVDLKAPGGKKVALFETLRVRTWETGIPDRYGVDYTMTFRCATDAPFTIEAYRYQGFGFRGRAEWRKENSDLVTSEGRTRANANGSRARWCDVYGDVPGGSAGVLFLSSPLNHEHPEPLRVWPANSNGGRGDVFFNFNPGQKKDWRLEPGRDYVLSYRMVVHEGALKPAEAESAWKGFAGRLGDKVVSVRAGKR